ncbi:myelin transcription factor 1-like [Macrobrachium nipponense]|uniref:myelin transcription factor 1-like n=1 Tax=Macrobrachium nipponense TaxID=159736 RepID=UPI0030C83B95
MMLHGCSLDGATATLLDVRPTCCKLSEGGEQKRGQQQAEEKLALQHGGRDVQQCCSRATKGTTPCSIITAHKTFQQNSKQEFEHQQRNYLVAFVIRSSLFINEEEEEEEDDDDDDDEGGAEEEEEDEEEEKKKVDKRRGEEVDKEEMEGGGGDEEEDDDGGRGG